jgi:hypothetical protein
VPDGRFERATSVPFTYTAAPSSRRRPSANDDTDAGELTVKVRRKYVVRYLWFESGP